MRRCRVAVDEELENRFFKLVLVEPSGSAYAEEGLNFSSDRRA